MLTTDDEVDYQRSTGENVLFSPEKNIVSMPRAKGKGSERQVNKNSLMIHIKSDIFV